MAASDPGRLIVLNGASSSGKTTLAEALLEVLPSPWFHVGIDTINAARSRARTAELNTDALEVVLARTRAGHAGAVAAMAWAGNDVIADVVLWRPGWLETWLESTTGLAVLFVGVQCSAAELARRETARGDRELGRAALQAVGVHAHARYDLVVDSEATSARRCAEQINDRLSQLHDHPELARAFDRLRADCATKSH
jgi:chloramphenicol 3-O phosphotransferase